MTALTSTTGTNKVNFADPTIEKLAPSGTLNTSTGPKTVDLNPTDALSAKTDTSTSDVFGNSNNSNPDETWTSMFPDPEDPQQNDFHRRLRNNGVDEIDIQLAWDA